MSTTNNITQSPASGRPSVDVMLEEVQRRESDLAAYLPPDVSPERFLQLARRMILEVPGIGECTSASVLKALRAAALSGLELDGTHATLIVRRSKSGPPTVTFDPT